MIGHNALAIPSAAAVAAKTKGIFQNAIASINVTTSAIKQAFQPAIFKTLIATINQIIGAKARMNIKNEFINFPLLIVFYERIVIRWEI